jgi:RimJ/RimL family protein N-acetyltransferase
MKLRRATPADLDAIMEIERQPGYDQFVGRSSADFHARAMTDPDYAYLVGLGGDEAISGFGILRDLTNGQNNTLLKRLAVRTPGKGVGSTLLDAITDWVFANTRTHRFWLDHIITNDRARHVYERCGFTREGVARQAYLLPDDSRVDLALMSILRPEWLLRSERACNPGGKS